MERKIQSETCASSRGQKLTVLFSIIFAGFYLSACGADPRGGVEGFGRKALGSISEVANGSDQLDIAVRYLAFKDSGGTAVASESAVRSMVDESSSIWAQCNIGFKLEHYEAVDPEAIGARYSPANYSELDEMRMATQSDADVVYIGTGAWNRSGTLGASGSNCFSSFPGDAAEGVVCEKSSAAKTTMFAHEIGHWVDLRHTNSPSTDYVDDTHSGNVGNNLMDHFVSPSNDDLTRGQCVRARAAIGEWRRNAVIEG